VPDKEASEPRTVVFHFVTDGFTVFSNVWYYGQEVRLDKDSDDYKSTLAPDGTSWLDLDEDSQIAKWGKRVFRLGPWKGKSYLEAEFPDPSYAPDPDALAKAQKQEAARAGRVPTVRLD
jgi:hypothetical protein